MKRIIAAIIIIIGLSGSAHAATQFDFLLSQVRTSANGALIGGKVYFYAAGTTTVKTVWLDAYQTTPAANPYTLDSDATAQLYGAGSYRVVVKDLAGVIRYDRDNIQGGGDDGTIYAINAVTGNQVFSLPAAGAVTIVKTDATANTVTVQPSIGGQTINGAASMVLTVQGETVRVGLSGTTWYVE